MSRFSLRTLFGFIGACALGLSFVELERWQVANEHRLAREIVACGGTVGFEYPNGYYVGDPHPDSWDDVDDPEGSFSHWKRPWYDKLRVLTTGARVRRVGLFRGCEHCLPHIGVFTQLTTLHIEGIPANDLSGLAPCQNLRMLKLDNVGDEIDYESILKLKSLTQCEVRGVYPPEYRQRMSDLLKNGNHSPLW